MLNESLHALFDPSAYDETSVASTLDAKGGDVVADGHVGTNIGGGGGGGATNAAVAAEEVSGFLSLSPFDETDKAATVASGGASPYASYVYRVP